MGEIGEHTLVGALRAGVEKVLQPSVLFLHLVLKTSIIAKLLALINNLHLLTRRGLSLNQMLQRLYCPVVEVGFGLAAEVWHTYLLDGVQGPQLNGVRARVSVLVSLVVSRSEEV